MKRTRFPALCLAFVIALAAGPALANGDAAKGEKTLRIVIYPFITGLIAGTFVVSALSHDLV